MLWAQWCVFTLQLWLCVGPIIYDGKTVTIRKWDCIIRVAVFFLLMAAGAFSHIRF